MKRFIHILAACIGIAAFPYISQAQSVTRAEFDSLKAEMVKMRRELGPYGDSVPPASDFQTQCVTLPNGRYSVWCRVQQIGVGIDANNVRVDSVESRVYQLSVQTAAVSAKVDQHIASAGNSGNIGTTYEAGTLYVPERIVIGNCPHPSRHLLVICGQQDADIHMMTNVSGQNPQGAAVHEMLMGAQADGGLRFIYNWVCSGGESVTVNNGACWIEPSKPRRILAFDSQGTLSFSDDQYPVIDNSQTFILGLDRTNKWANWTLMKAGWTWRNCTSTGTNTFDKCYPVPQQ